MTIKLLSWNVNGIRAGLKKGLLEKIAEINPDIWCIQETKADTETMAGLCKELGYQNYASQNDSLMDVEKSSLKSILWSSCSNKKGYSGVANLFTERPDLVLKNYQIGLGIEEFDVEGRVVVTEFEAGQGKLNFALINGYYPQGGRGPHRVEYKLRFYNEINLLAKKYLDKGINVILCGDLNTTIGDIDLARPKENAKTTGCLPEERVALNWLVNDTFFDPNKLVISNPDFQKFADLKVDKIDLVDTFRHFYPDLEGKYSYWDQITRARERNVGWRIDYFLADKGLLPKLKSATILDQVMGSDHAPVILEIEI